MNRKSKITSPQNDFSLPHSRSRLTTFTYSYFNCFNIHSLVTNFHITLASNVYSQLRWRCILHVYFTYIFTHSYLSNNSDKLNIDSRSWKTRNRDFSSFFSFCSILPFDIQKKKMMKILFSHDHITVKWTKKMCKRHDAKYFKFILSLYSSIEMIQ